MITIIFTLIGFVAGVVVTRLYFKDAIKTGKATLKKGAQAVTNFLTSVADKL